MTWFKVDDSFYDHPKIFDAPDCALALWVRAGCWSARSLKDGFVPANLPARLCDDPDTAVRALVDRGLWKKVRGGFQFHDWSEYQPSAEHVKELRAKRAEAGKRGGQAKAANQKAGKSLASASPVAQQISTPSRPVPSRRDGDGSVGGHLQVADARANEGREQLCRNYNLTDDKAEQAMTTIAKNSRGPVKDWPSLLDHMAGNGTLAAIVDPLQRPEPPPSAEPARRTVTGCDTHPDGAIDPVPPDGWGQCLLCNTRRHRAQPNRRTA